MKIGFALPNIGPVATAEAVGKCFLQLSHFVISTGKKRLCLRGLKLGDANLVLLQLVGMAANLLGANGVFLLERLDPLYPASCPSARPRLRE
jgi:hypothetical protein